jgi:hypothetical protein
VLVALSEKKWGIGTVEMSSAGAALDRRDGRGGQDDAGGPSRWLWSWSFVSTASSGLYITTSAAGTGPGCYWSACAIAESRRCNTTTASPHASAASSSASPIDTRAAGQFAIYSTWVLHRRPDSCGAPWRVYGGEIVAAARRGGSRARARRRRVVPREPEPNGKRPTTPAAPQDSPRGDVESLSYCMKLDSHLVVVLE